MMEIEAGKLIEFGREIQSKVNRRLFDISEERDILKAI